MKMNKLVAAMVLLPLTAQGQSVPAISPVAAMGPSVIDTPPIVLDAKERRALAIAKEWKNSPDKPRRSADGSVVYLYGATLPTLICTTLQICTIHLQPGEVVNGLPHVGDPRWNISPAKIGNGANEVTVVVVKPTERGLVTSMIIATNRRIYTIKLVSPKHENVWIPRMSFDYPEDNEQAWRDYGAKQGQVVNSTTLANGMNIGNLDFGYKISGDSPPWKPVRVYSDPSRNKTFIEFDSLSNEAPALVALESKGSLFTDPETEILNYRPYGKGYLVDGTPSRFALISGVGNSQKKVIIEKTGGTK